MKKLLIKKLTVVLIIGSLTTGIVQAKSNSRSSSSRPTTRTAPRPAEYRVTQPTPTHSASTPAAIKKNPAPTHHANPTSAKEDTKNTQPTTPANTPTSTHQSNAKTNFGAFLGGFALGNIIPNLPTIDSSIVAGAAALASAAYLAKNYKYMTRDTAKEAATNMKNSMAHVYKNMTIDTAKKAAINMKKEIMQNPRLFMRSNAAPYAFATAGLVAGLTLQDYLKKQKAAEVAQK
jgi:hypothetical protein